MKNVQLLLRIAELENRVKSQDEVLKTWAEELGHSLEDEDSGSPIEIESTKENTPCKSSSPAQMTQGESSSEEELSSGDESESSGEDN